MHRWLSALRINPIPALLNADDEGLTYFVRRDLLGDGADPVERVWETPAAQKILQPSAPSKQQQENGSWRYPGQNRHVFLHTNYDLLETWKQLAILEEQHGLDRRHPAIERAVEYLLSFQTEEGDIRGVLGTQYMPYYHGIICEVILKAGYESDPRLLRGLDWLLSFRQEDGGWLVPMQALPARAKTPDVWSAEPQPLDRSLPSSHLATGMALRPLALHPDYQRLPELRSAAELLSERFFRPDKYNDRKASSYWTKFQFPFRWNNLLTALDSLSHMGFSSDDDGVKSAVEWFVHNQSSKGLWRTSYEQAKHGEPSSKERQQMQWVTLAICRVLKRFIG